MAHSKLRARTPERTTDDESTQTCPDCNGTLRTTDTETTCEDCGLITDTDRLDRGPEWRLIDSEDESRKRTGAPRTAARHDKGLSTQIGNNYDANGNPVTAEKRRTLHRLRRHHVRARFETGKERNQAYVFAEIRRITSALGLAQSVRDRACDLFRSAQSEDLIQGRTLEGYAAACVYAVCRCMGLPWTRDDFAPVARCSREKMGNAYDAMNTELGLPTRPLNAAAFVPRFAAELDVSDAARQQAETLAEQADRDASVNGKPAAIGAAALYLAALGTADKCSQDEAARVAECSDVTIRSRYRDLRTLRDDA